ncbi:ankyrin repeat domain-containing protein [Streptacidiphilus fuscans]|uniref:Ankyrin repeat domain-containing protein n=1 Tax=Streptacidiphilus fuscans TaxID=2789292 RepID=A0A931FA09_9ACTN|nr:ankyrin repeat domain-containing protein [Streptacidiphilus fuscans]MBF9067172.1 ankyrin repeat domain-containing protein [Streptacidiphilus fuscans]
MTDKPTPTSASASLLDAAARGDVEAVRAALDAGADTEVRDDSRRTPLLLAALADHVAVAEVLVAAGADVNAQDDRDDSAWLVTGVTGSVEMMRTLLPAGPDLTLTNRFGGISVIPASERGHVAYVRAVLAETATDVDHVNRLGWTALLEAVILGDGGPVHQQVVEILLAAGADPAIRDHDGLTARVHAERRGFLAMADTLRAAEASR